MSLLQTAFGGDKKVNIWLETIKTELKKSAESKTSVEGWRQLFERYDLDGSGDVDKSEFVQTAREVLEIPADAISDAELDRLFEEADADGGGEISGSEFADWIVRQSADEVRASDRLRPFMLGRVTPIARQSCGPTSWDRCRRRTWCAAAVTLLATVARPTRRL